MFKKKKVMSSKIIKILYLQIKESLHKHQNKQIYNAFNLHIYNIKLHTLSLYQKYSNYFKILQQTKFNISSSIEKLKHYSRISAIMASFASLDNSANLVGKGLNLLTFRRGVLQVGIGHL